MAILGIALGAGVIVYALSLRAGDERLSLQPAPREGETEPTARPRRARKSSRAVGFDPNETSTAASEASTYVPLSADETPWQRRVAGLVGLIVLVAVAAALLAGAIYQVGHLVNQTIARFLQ